LKTVLRAPSVQCWQSRRMPKRRLGVQRLRLSFLVYLFAGTSSATQVTAHDWSDVPLWAYGVTTVPHAGDKAKPPETPQRKFDPAIDHVEQLRPLRVDGSERTFSLVDLSDWQNAVDWFPNEHVPMPSVVQHGPASLGTMTRACAFCHKTTGGGRPDNASVTGLPAQYFLRQLEDFRSGRRKSSDPRKSNVPTMIALAQSMSEEEESAAAGYYAAQSGGPPVRVIETVLAADASGKATAGLACKSCHGAGLLGVGDTPPIAGRSPSYLVGQLYDFKTGARGGMRAVLMKSIVARLTQAQMTDIAAYVASLPRVEVARH
jgi:cytochrome c553